MKFFSVLGALFLALIFGTLAYMSTDLVGHVGFGIASAICAGVFIVQLIETKVNS